MVMIGRTVTPGDFMSISRNEMPACGFRGRIGAHQAKDPVGMLRQRGPGLVAVDDIMIAVAHRLGADRGEVGARARLGIALAPPVLAGQNPRQEFLLLRVIAERIDHGADHGDAERQRRQRSGARRLLFEDEALGDRPAGPAIFLRPQRRDPAFLVQDAVPEQHLLLGQVGLRIGNTHFLRIILRDEGAHLVAKGRVFSGKAELHRNRSLYHFSPNGRISSSNVQALLGCW